ncbi:MAG: radical SAM protein [Lachnospiraceae bacterium]|nr:radical SAM protein [Lachnospiraceae bacterium]
MEIGMIKNKLHSKIILKCTECVFRLKTRHLSKKKQNLLWERKKEKYYVPLFHRDNGKIPHLFSKLLKAEWMQEVKILPRIVIVISTRCTLKCKYCGEFIPYFENKTDICVQQIVYDLECLLGQMDYICTLEFIGGEPFLHKDMDILLRNVKQYKEKIGKVEITTNGTVRIEEKLLPLLRDEKVEVLISNYKVNAEKVRELRKKLKSEKINHKVLDAKYWTDSGKIVFNGLSKKDTYKMYMQCYAASDCRTLYKGKLLLCSRGPYMIELGYYPNCVDIHKTNLCKNLYAFYLRSGYATCKYCKHNEKKIPVAEQI